MVVIVIMGILATLAYSSLVELISTNRAKETAQTIRTFTERALMDGKRLNKPVKISIVGNEIIADTAVGETTTYKKMSSEALNQGFSKSDDVPVSGAFKNEVISEIRIGLSGVNGDGSFAACFKGYCGGAGKAKNENSFKAYIKRGNGADWGPL